MSLSNNIATIAHLIGDKTRATILVALMENKALTAGELAIIANITPQTASNHLNKLADHHLVSCKSAGRHRYYKLVSSDVAKAIESLSILMPLDKEKPSQPKMVINGDIKKARSCYDHLAGQLGVAVTKALLHKKYLTLSNDKFTLTKKGNKFFQSLGIDSNQLQNLRRPMMRACIDWTEREYHLAGSLGKELLNYFLSNHLVIKSKSKSRVLVLTTKGKTWLSTKLSLRL